MLKGIVIGIAIGTVGHVFFQALYDYQIKPWLNSTVIPAWKRITGKAA